MTSSVKSRPKFRIVEGGTSSQYADIYEDFKKDYLSPDITKARMLEKYDISDNTYYHLKDLVAEETGVNRKQSKAKVTRTWTHFSRFIDQIKSSGKYRVTKVINGKKTHFGVYNDIATAVMVRDRLEENNWSMKTYRQIRHEVFNEPLEDSIDVEEIYDELKSDFLNGESVRYIKRKYQIGQGTYDTLSRQIRNEEGLVRKPQLEYKEMRRHERDLHRQQHMQNLL